MLRRTVSLALEKLFLLNFLHFCDMVLTTHDGCRLSLSIKLEELSEADLSSSVCDSQLRLPDVLHFDWPVDKEAIRML